jgi:TonB family protein
MSNLPIPKPDPAKVALNENSETDLTELAALFAAKSGAGVSAKLSTGLALEIVLNEIVEQACLATGATGAAVILERDGEMVCRATSGPTAPELGSHPDGESLTAECLRTGRIQLCDDTLNDARVDAEASRNIDARSVIVLPLIQDGALIGVLEAFSPRPAAFGDRDQRTLEALGERILKNLRRASQPLVLHSVKPAALDDPLAENPSLAGAEPEEHSLTSAEQQTPKAGVDILTVVLAAACVVCLVLIVTLIVLRATSHKMSAARSQTTSQPAESDTSNEPATPDQSAEPTPAQTGVSGASAPESKSEQNPSKPIPAGGLVVYDGGKEVFRLPPSSSAGEKSATSGSAKTEEIINLSPDAAESSLTYRQEPEYPEEARRQGIQGPVVLEVRIGRDGAVQNVTLISGQEILGKAAIAAVKQWRFKPRYLQGRPAEMQTRVTLNFRLPQ